MKKIEEEQKRMDIMDNTKKIEKEVSMLYHIQYSSLKNRAQS